VRRRLAQEQLQLLHPYFTCFNLCTSRRTQQKDHSGLADTRSVVTPLSPHLMTINPHTQIVDVVVYPLSLTMALNSTMDPRSVPSLVCFC